MAETEIDAVFGKWFNSHGHALSFIEEPFYAGWHARDHEVMLLREALIAIADAAPNKPSPGRYVGRAGAFIHSLQATASMALGRPKSPS